MAIRSSAKASQEGVRQRRFGQVEEIMGWVFALPWIIGFLAFVAYPLIHSLFLSFTEYDVLNPPYWVGLENFQMLLTEDPIFWTALSNTAYMVVFGVPLQVLTGLSLAMLLNQDVKGMAVYRSIYYLPSIVPVVASSILWMWILNPQFGLLNAALKAIGITGPTWLGSPKWSKPSLILMMMWGAGGSMIIYLAGLKGIPEQLYEAARIDGAGVFRQFFSITLPMITPTLFFTTITGIIGTFQMFTEAFVMTQGGPVQSTLFYVYYLFNNAFAYFRMGYASAMAWILFVVILIITAIQLRVSEYWVFYEAEEPR